MPFVPRIRAQVVCLLLLAALGSFCGIRAQPVASREYQVKAVFLFNFIRYVEWPASAFPAPDSPYLIGILGDDPFGRFLDETIIGETVRGRKLQVRRGRSVSQLKECHLVFISRSERSRQASILAEFAGQPVLTVSEMEGFARRGGILNFVLEKGHIRFEANIKAADRARLKISSQLLKLARIVEGEWRPR